MTSYSKTSLCGSSSERMNPLSRATALDYGKALFRFVNNNPSCMGFRTKMRSDFGFYEGGIKQWLPSDLKIIAERDQVPISVNLLQSLIDNLSGVEIQSRYRVACRSDSQNKEDEQLAIALTHLLYAMQEENSIPHLGSLKFRDMLICGIGWSYLYSDKGVKKYEYVHPSLIYADPDDLSPQYNNMRYVVRKRWMRADVIKKTWPKADLEIPASWQASYESYSPELLDRNADTTDQSSGQSSGSSGSKILVVEVQVKIETVAYCGLDRKGHYFETFNEEEAHQIAADSKEIKEIPSARIMRILFMDDQLLEYGPLDPDLPNPTDFSYIPCVWKRAFDTGIPYGLLEGGKSLQRDLNVRLTKSVYAFNSTRIVAETDELMEGKQIEAIRAELKKADSVIFLPKESKFQLSNNTQLGDDQLKIIEAASALLPKTLGINDEMLGYETNATSGVSQKIRQVNSVRNNVFAFDNFAEMKKREAKFMLSMIQGGFDPNIAVQILGEQEKTWIVLNLAEETEDGMQIFNDIRNLPISLYVEEVPDFRSTAEERQAQLEALLGNPNAQLILMSPELMKESGIREGDKISAEVMKALQAKAQIEAGAKNPVQGQGPSPEQMPMPSSQIIQGGL